MKPCLVSTWGPSPKKYLGAFLDTAKRQGMEPQNFDATDWPGADWTQIPWYKKSEGQARFVQENVNKYSHFIFTDSYDVVFAAGYDEIIGKFDRLDAPIVFAAECYCWPDQANVQRYPSNNLRCRFLNAGMWIATAKAALPFTLDLALIAAQREKCDQGIVTEMFLSGRYGIALDGACSIAFCCNINSLDFLDLSGPRPKTKDTGEEPCLFHGNGGSSLTEICAKIAP